MYSLCFCLFDFYEVCGNDCFYFVFLSPCIWITCDRVSCGSTRESSMHHTFYKTCLYKCGILIFRRHTRRQGCVCITVWFKSQIGSVCVRACK
jgi:hypothetical protein